MAAAPIDRPPSAASPPEKKPQWGRVAIFVGALAAFALIPLPLCPVRLLLRIPCPGCGATRAVLSAVRGDWVGSWKLHPLALPAVALIIPSLLLVSRSIAMGDPARPLPRPLRAAWTVFFVVLFALWIVRFFGMFGGPAPI